MTPPNLMILDGAARKSALEASRNNARRRRSSLWMLFGRWKRSLPFVLVHPTRFRFTDRASSLELTTLRIANRVPAPYQENVASGTPTPSRRRSLGRGKPRSSERHRTHFAATRDREHPPRARPRHVRSSAGRLSYPPARSPVRRNLSACGHHRPDHARRANGDYESARGLPTPTWQSS